MDTLAGHFNIGPHPAWACQAIPHPDSAVELLQQGHIITSHILQMVIEVRHTANTRKMIIKRAKWLDTIIGKIDWDSHEAAVKHNKTLQYLSLCKIIHANYHTCSRDNKFYGLPHGCPFCDEKETFNHVFTCPSDHPSAFRAMAKDTLKEALSKLNTPKVLTTVLLHGIQQRTSLSPESKLTHAPTRGLMST